ncbi:MAG: hypothetical protein HUU15_11185 [Candidatus Brocadiae bacterium]|nr:hypothetical protein [Candidatus Brocadiia bacterium]
MLPVTVWNLVRWTAVLLILAAFAGCRKRTRHVQSAGDDDIFTTDDFPGAPVQDGNVADDGRAMSPAGEDAFPPVCIRNGDRGTAIVLFATAPEVPGGPAHLYATHFDGESWTPPVELSAWDGQFFTKSFGPRAVVAFLNTEDHPDGGARDRDGDALIAWGGVDLDQDGASPADDVNGCVFVTYFNVSDRDDPSRNHGFQGPAQRVSTEDELDEDVFAIGFVSDGLCGQASYSSLSRSYSWGDPTTGIALAWTQSENNDNLTPGSDDIAMHAVVYNLAQAGDPETPLTAGPDIRVPILGFGALDSGLGSEETIVNPDFTAYNNLLFMQVASDDSPGAEVLMIYDPPLSLFVPFGTYGSPMDADDDITVQVVAFDPATGTIGPPRSLANTPDSTDSIESHDQLVSPARRSIWGSDEGLAEVVVFHTILLADPDATTFFGSITVDGSLFATSLDEATGTPVGSAILDPENPMIFDSVLPNEVETQISRNGDYLWVVWGELDGGGVFAERSLRAAQLLTVRLDADGGIPAAIPPISARFGPALTLNAHIDGYNVDWFMLQRGLGYLCGAQSDPDVLHVFFEHSDPSGDVIFDARLVADLEAPIAPSASVSVLATFENMEMGLGSFVQGGDLSPFSATDAGGNGEALCVYRRDIDPSAAVDYRAFARVTGAGSAEVEIDSRDPVRQSPGAFRLIGTPSGSETGLYDPATGDDSDDRPHGWTRVDVLFFESNTTETSGHGFALRARAFLADSESTLPLGDRFAPPAGGGFLPPVELSLPWGDPDLGLDPRLVGTATAGDTVGVWFTEQGHLYYQESDGDGRWRERDGVSDPALVDDDTAVEVPAAPSPLPGFFASTCTCDRLRGAMVFWLKELDGASGHARIQVRVRD